VKLRLRLVPVADIGCMAGERPYGRMFRHDQVAEGCRGSSMVLGTQRLRKRKMLTEQEAKTKKSVRDVPDVQP